MMTVHIPKHSCAVAIPVHYHMLAQVYFTQLFFTMCFSVGAGLTGGTIRHISKYQHACHIGMHTWSGLASFGATLYRQCATDGQLYIPSLYRTVGARLAVVAPPILLAVLTVSALSMEPTTGLLDVGYESEVSAFTWSSQYAYADMVSVTQVPHGVFVGDSHIGYAGSISKGDALSLEGAFDIASFESDGRTYAVVASYHDSSVQILDITHPYGITSLGSITGDDGWTSLCPGRHCYGTTALGSITGDDIRLSGAVSITTFMAYGRTYAAVAEYDGGVQILDLTDPYNVTPAGNIANDDALLLSGAYDIATFQSAGRTYAAVTAYWDDGVQILDLTYPYNVTSAGNIADDDVLLLSGAYDIATFQSAGRTYAAVAALGDDGVQILDLTDPYNIVPAGNIADDDALSLLKPRGVMTFQSAGRTYAAVTAYWDDGVQILDLTDPYNVIPVGNLVDDGDTLLNGAMQITAFQSAGRTYAAVTAHHDNSVQILDLTDPYNVTPAGNIADDGILSMSEPFGIMTFQSAGRTYVAVAAYGDDGVQILDLTDPYNIVPAGGANDATLRLHRPADVAVYSMANRTYAAVLSDDRRGSLQILDLTDPYAITAAGTISNDSGLRLIFVTDLVVFESGNRTYAATVTPYGGVHTLDITDPYDIIPAGIVAITEDALISNANDIAVFRVDGNIYAAVTSSNQGVQVLDMSDPYNITLAGQITHEASHIIYSAETIDTFESGDRVYAAVAGYNGGVQTLDLSDPYNITTAGIIEDNEMLNLDRAWDISVFETGSRTYALVTSSYNTGSYRPPDYEDGIQMLDLTDPYNIVPTSGITDNAALILSGAHDAAIFGLDGRTYAAVTSYYEDGIQMLDLTDPYNIMPAGSIDGDTVPLLDVWSGIDIFDSDGRIYAAVASPGSNSVWSFDLTDTHNIIPADVITDDVDPVLSGARGLAVFESDGSTYVTVASDEGIQILDLTDIYNIAAADGLLYNHILRPGGAYSVDTFASKDRTYAAAVFPNTDTLIVLDTTNPYGVGTASHITDDDQLRLSGVVAVTIFVSDERTYAVTASFEGIQMLDLTNPYNIISAGGIGADTSPLLGGARDVAIFEMDGRTYAGVVSFNDSVCIIDLTDPYNITLASSLIHHTGAGHRGAFGIAVFESDEHTYAAVTSLGDNEVQILDLTNPYGIIPADSISDDPGLLLSGAFGIAVFELDGHTYAAVTSLDGVQILDLTDPQSIMPVYAIADQIFRPLSDARDVAIFQSDGHTYAAVASYADGGVQILQISTGDGSGS